jgi:hypothetical protein
VFSTFVYKQMDAPHRADLGYAEIAGTAFIFKKDESKEFGRGQLPPARQFALGQLGLSEGGSFAQVRRVVVPGEGIRKRWVYLEPSMMHAVRQEQARLLNLESQRKRQRERREEKGKMRRFKRCKEEFGDLI